MTDYVKPFDGENNLNRQQLAMYFNRIGRGINCRMDVPILVMSDVRWAAKVFSELGKTLTQLGWEDERSDIYRILSARHAMEAARFQLAQVNQKKEAVKAWKKAQDRRR